MNNYKHLILSEMKHNYTNLEMLVIGIEEIAMNHGFDYLTEDYMENMQVGILGCNVPTLFEVQMLCENIGIDSADIEHGWYGITVWISDSWYEGKANEIYKPEHEMWRKNQ